MAHSILCDIDGVLCRGAKIIPGARRFVSALRRSGRKFLFLTNSLDHSPAENRTRLLKLTGVDVPEDAFYTSAQALASFLASQHPRARVYAIGSRALKDELKRGGARLVDRRADFVVACSGGAFGVEQIQKAVELIDAGARLITANREPNCPAERGTGPGCGAYIASIERATHREAYCVGKPNHLMIRAVEKRMNIRAQETIMIGDSLRTDIDVGLQAQMKTVLVLSGITTAEDLQRSPFQPHFVFPSVARIDLQRLP